MPDISEELTVMPITICGAKCRERRSARKGAMYIFNTERSHFKKLNEIEGKEQLQVNISNRFTALKTLVMCRHK
jgi:hypothetical protein